MQLLASGRRPSELLDIYLSRCCPPTRCQGRILDDPVMCSMLLLRHTQLQLQESLPLALHRCCSCRLSFARYSGWIAILAPAGIAIANPEATWTAFESLEHTREQGWRSMQQDHLSDRHATHKKSLDISHHWSSLCPPVSVSMCCPCHLSPYVAHVCSLPVWVSVATCYSARPSPC
jgi:hypothetical protein